MRFVTMLAFCLFCASTVPAHDHCGKAECREVKQKIRIVRAKMRQGYTRAQGEKLQDELRRLREIRSRKCR